MVNYVRYKYFLIHNGESYHFHTETTLVENFEEETQMIEQITWNNLIGFYYKYGMWLPFDVLNLKNGLLLFPHNDGKKLIPHWIKSWKNPDFTMDFLITKPELVRDWSIQDIIKCHKGDLAIKFLAERGLNPLDK